jgi:GTP diphosphokinase / guanosine-3',5'-bis(diphosphate) 3'-diphosphatase
MSARRSGQAEQSPAIALIEDSSLLSNSMPVESPAVADAVTQLLESVHASSPTANLDLVQRAARFAIAAHGTDLRQSGDPYVVHPIAVATILARIHLDSETIAAALLHDVVEDTPVTVDAIRTEFGPRVALLVDGVSKLGRIHWPSDQPDGASSREKAHQAENLRKMFLAMVDDIGVVLIKLADRLHNMRTLDALPPEKRKRIAQQTVSVSGNSSRS